MLEMHTHPNSLVLAFTSFDNTEVMQNVINNSYYICLECTNRICLHCMEFEKEKCLWFPKCGKNLKIFVISIRKTIDLDRCVTKVNWYFEIMVILCRSFPVFLYTVHFSLLCILKKSLTIFVWYIYNTLSKFNIRLNSCVTIN